MYTHTHNKVFLYHKRAHYMTRLRWPCVPWFFRRLFGCLLLQAAEFEPRSVRVEFLVHKVALGQVFP